MKTFTLLCLTALASGCVTDCGGEPDKALWYKEQGDYYYQNGKWPQAHAEYMAALRVDENYLEAAIALVYTCRMQAHVARLEDRSQGEPFGRRRPCEPDAALRESVVWANEALRISPKNPDAHYAAALALEDGGRLAEADGHLRSALDSDPEFPLAHLERARIAFRRARALPPESRDEALELLRASALSVEQFLANHEKRHGHAAAGAQDLQRWTGVLRDMAAHDGALTDEGKALLYLMDPDYHEPPVIHERDLPR